MCNVTVSHHERTNHRDYLATGRTLEQRRIGGECRRGGVETERRPELFGERMSRQAPRRAMPVEQLIHLLETGNPRVWTESEVGLFFPVIHPVVVEMRLWDEQYRTRHVERQRARDHVADAPRHVAVRGVEPRVEVSIVPQAFGEVVEVGAQEFDAVL